jgi:NAD(P)-dependent dehydrogenase (short-subunit alcohol dehydrogenase family)
MASPPRAVLITGCTSGIGRATAEIAAAAGYFVLAGMRRHGNGPLAAPAGCEAVELDVTDETSVARAMDEVRVRCPGGLYALVNNAGIAPPAATELADLDEFRRVLEVNTIAPLRMIQACLPLLRRGKGRIINMSSMNGSVALPIVGVYSASKFALEALSTTLQIELRPWGIPVSVIRPGQVKTDIFAKAGESLVAGAKTIPPELQTGYGPLYEHAFSFNQRGAAAKTTPEDVGRKVLKALTARWPKPRYYVGFDAVGLQIMFEWLPTLIVNRILARLMGTFHRLKE